LRSSATKAFDSSSSIDHHYSISYSLMLAVLLNLVSTKMQKRVTDLYQTAIARVEAKGIQLKWA